MILSVVDVRKPNRCPDAKNQTKNLRCPVCKDAGLELYWGRENPTATGLSMLSFPSEFSRAPAE